MRRVLFVWFVCVFLLGGCVALLDFDGYDTSVAPVVQRSDAGDTPPGKATDGGAAIVDFAVEAPDLVRVVAGASADTTLRVRRAAGFSGTIDIVAVDVPASITLSLPPIGATEVTSTLRVSVSPAAKQGTRLDVHLELRSGKVTRPAVLGLYVVGPPGTLDTSFADGGLLLVDETPGSVHPVELFVSDAGLTLVATKAVDYPYDPNFVSPAIHTADLDGRQVTHAVVAPAAWRVRSARREEGALLLAGDLDDAEGTAVRVARHYADGGTDPAYGDGGAAMLRGFTPRITDRIPMESHGDGGVLLATGTCDDPTCSLNGGKSFRVMALDPSGTLDPTFAAGGTLEIPSATTSNWIYAMLRLPDRRMLVAFYDRLDVLDFDAGAATFFGPAVTSAWDLVHAPDGRIFVAGVPSGVFGGGALFVLKANGSMDTSYGNGGAGKVGMQLNGATRLVLDKQGRALVAARRLFRFDTAGFLDATFGFAGAVSANAAWTLVALAADGRIYVAGVDAGPGSSLRLLVARYWP